MRRLLVLSAFVAAGIGLPAQSPAATISVVQTTNSATLSAALGGTGLTINSAMNTNGNVAQFGTYSNFSLISNGVVLSSGVATDVATGPFPNSQPSTIFNSGGTAEFNSYGPGRIQNFMGSHDVARLEVNFTLAAASAVAFDFIFGSIEFPVFTSQFTDAFLVFLDGFAATDQVTFDANNMPVQVGTSFGGLVDTSNMETAFGNPHGLIPMLTTTTATLAAGNHTLYFEVGDVNDAQLDSAVFLANLRTAMNPGGPNTGQVPVPPSIVLMGLGGLGYFGAALRQRRKLLAV